MHEIVNRADLLSAALYCGGAIRAVARGIDGFLPVRQWDGLAEYCRPSGNPAVSSIRAKRRFFAPVIPAYRG